MYDAYVALWYIFKSYGRKRGKLKGTGEKCRPPTTYKNSQSQVNWHFLYSHNTHSVSGRVHSAFKYRRGPFLHMTENGWFPQKL